MIFMMSDGAQKILLVEDDKAQAELICRAFDMVDSPYELTVTHSLAEARRALAREFPDLLITDLQLPDGRGTELLTPEQAEDPPFPMVVLTSHGNEKVAVEAMKAGALDYVVKTADVLFAIPRFAERALREWGLITDRKRAVEERRRIEMRMQHAQKLESLGVLAGGIAHDFNNLVMAIMGHVEIALLDLPGDSPVGESLRDIETVAARASELCRQLLAYSGKDRFVVEPLDLNRLVAEMVQLLETVISKKAHLDLQLSNSLPSIEASSAQLRQVVMNLITNASDALGGQTGTISIQTGLTEATDHILSQNILEDPLPAGLYVFVEVSDTGCGMDDETQTKLFDPFFTTKASGRGLGMAAVKGIVQSHKGAISLSTEKGKGTTFRILFPPGKRKKTPARSPASGDIPFIPSPTKQRMRDSLSSRSEPTKTTPPVPPVPPFPPVESSKGPHEGASTILVVDDDVTIRAVTTIALEGAGFLVITAEDGLEGLEAFKRHRREIAAILLDISMPRLSGDETLIELQKLGIEAPVIASSGHAERDVVKRMPGLTGYIQKPYQAAELIDKVRKVLGT